MYNLRPITKMAVSVTIKGIKEGLLVTVGEGDWSEASHTLFEKLHEKEEFFKGARLTSANSATTSATCKSICGRC